MIDLSAYQGRWVAASGTAVVASGDTAVDAYRAAQRLDPGENFYLYFVGASGVEPLSFPPILQVVRSYLVKEGLIAYLVGGAVRDALMERQSHDLDFIVPRDAITLTFRLADAIGAPAYVLDDERDIGRIVLASENLVLDFARFRGSGLLDDLRERDFTVNAMALPVFAPTRASVIDPSGGLADLESRLIRMTDPQALARDPIRALRAIRLAAELGLSLTPGTREAVQATSGSLAHGVSAERVRDEVIKIVRDPQPDQTVTEMERLGLLGVVLPEIAALAEVPQTAPHYEAVLPHTVSVLRWLERLEALLDGGEVPQDPALASVQAILAPHLDALKRHLVRAVGGGIDGRLILRLAALFHDVGKKATLTIGEDGAAEDNRYRFFGHAEVGAELAASRLRQLCFSNDAIAQSSQIVAEHMRPLLLLQSQGAKASRRAAYRYFKAAGANGLDVGILALADHLATYDGPGEEASWLSLLELISSLYDSYFEHHAEAISPPALVDGHDLMEHLDLRPCPEIGRLLRLIAENQAAGEINTREEALRFARQQRR